jgi:hypothetical protein
MCFDNEIPFGLEFQDFPMAVQVSGTPLSPRGQLRVKTSCYRFGGSV